MIIDQDNKTIQIEARDVNYILPPYVRLYLFHTRNEEPEKIIFPMFQQVPHPNRKGIMVPIEYVPENSPIAVAIKQDGSNVTESTPESEAVADKKEAEYQAAKARIAELEALLAETKTEDAGAKPKDSPQEPAKLSPARAAFAAEEPESAIAGADDKLQPSAERVAKAKQPENPAPPGASSDYGGRRDAGDLSKIARDIAPEKDVPDESKEVLDDGLVHRAKKGKKS